LPCSKSLPAAIATNTPRPEHVVERAPVHTAYLIADSIAGAGGPARPMLMLMMCAPLSAA
jgi:hypothetical protein